MKVKRVRRACSRVLQSGERFFVAFEREKGQSKLQPRLSQAGVKFGGTASGGSGSFQVSRQAEAASEIGDRVREFRIDLKCPREKGNRLIGAPTILKDDTKLVEPLRVRRIDRENPLANRARLIVLPGVDQVRRLIQQDFGSNDRRSNGFRMAEG